MDLKTPLKIPILYNNPEDEQFRNLGIEFEDKPIEVLMIFFTIDNLSPEGINSKNTVIVSGGFRYITLLDMEYLTQVIYQVQNPHLFSEHGHLTQVI
jgi:hypothetical protein